MIDDQILRSHCQEMERQDFPVYQIFDLLERADLSAEDLALLREEASHLAEIVVSQELPFDSESRQTIDVVIKSGMPEAQEALSAWTTAINAAADASRRSMKIMFRGFGQWLQETDQTLRDTLFEVLPQLAPSIHQLDIEGVLEILRFARTLNTSEDRQTLLKLAGYYGSTTSEMVLGICRIAHRSIEWEKKDYLERLPEIFPLEEDIEDTYADKLIPALAELSEYCAERGKDFWYQALELILCIAQENYSSAYSTTRKLMGRLQKLSPDIAGPYLEDFNKLVKSIGIRVIGFSLRDLPEFYRKYGTERTRTFIEGAASAGETYGAKSGQWFLERRTEAARQVLGA